MLTHASACAPFKIRANARDLLIARYLLSSSSHGAANLREETLPID